MEKFNLAKFLKDAPKGLPLWSRHIGHEVTFNSVTEHNNIVCFEFDEDGGIHNVFFDEFGRIVSGTCEDIVSKEVDLVPQYYHFEWDGDGISSLMCNPLCINKVVMDKIDPVDDLEFPWIIGNTAMWGFDDVLDKTWESIRFHKFDFSNVRFATEEETKEFFEAMHEFGLDFKDGTPIKNGENAEPECRNAAKEQFFDALSDLCKNWKGTIPDADFYEVLFKFDTEVIFPKLKKAFGWNSKIIMNKD